MQYVITNAFGQRGCRHDELFYWNGGSWAWPSSHHLTYSTRGEARIAATKARLCVFKITPEGI